MTDKEWLYAQNWVEQTQSLLHLHYRGGIHWAVGVCVPARAVVRALHMFDPEAFRARNDMLQHWYEHYLPYALLR